MRRAFKVATVFTGAAACAAAFTPATMAGAATTGQMKPDTSVRECYKSPTTSAALWYRASAHHGPICFGGANHAGPVYLSYAYFTRFCAGNNSGSYYRDGTGPVSFSRGNMKTVNAGVGSLTISKWYGSDHCTGT